MMSLATCVGIVGASVVPSADARSLAATNVGALAVIVPVDDSVTAPRLLAKSPSAAADPACVGA